MDLGFTVAKVRSYDKTAQPQDGSPTGKRRVFRCLGASKTGRGWATRQWGLGSGAQATLVGWELVGV